MRAVARKVWSVSRDSRLASPRATRARISSSVTRGAWTTIGGTSVCMVSSTARVGPGGLIAAARTTAKKLMRGSGRKGAAR